MSLAQVQPGVTVDNSTAGGAAEEGGEHAVFRSILGLRRAAPHIEHVSH
jgi:hypothetical protein